jgi:hypothetical protein
VAYAGMPGVAHHYWLRGKMFQSMKLKWYLLKELP